MGSSTSDFEAYIQDLQEIRNTGAAVQETSYYGALEQFLNGLGKMLTPKVRCVMQLKNTGAGMPDGGLYTASQFQKKTGDRPVDPGSPERGVIEIKGTGNDAWVTATTPQVSKYWNQYRQVLVTNYRDFILIGENEQGEPAILETYRLAQDETEFWQKVQNPRLFAQEQGEQISEYLKRVMLQSARIATPQDLAWLLASYAKDARARLDQTDLPALESLRKALEDALGITFTGDKKDPLKGERFFKSTLVQTLFYGVFSAWVLWHEQQERGRFDWRVAGYYLHVPMIKALFEKVATPTHVRRLDLEEVLNWAGDALNRVDRASFFTKFKEDQAVQYFYEPFLEAFDPQLRKELGVWYTPPEIVQYMVARVDAVLREELDIAEGLADSNVYVLDPCCGTGAFLVEVLRKIQSNLQDSGVGALLGAQLKQAALNRVFGFELLTAPFVVAHLQLGLFLQKLGTPLVEEEERVGVYLTNALTGWQSPSDRTKAKIQQLAIDYPELQEERDAADAVKRQKPILVVLGNPPYNAYAGTSSREEEGLIEAYKTGLIDYWGIKKFNLDELYTRFFRIAEYCIEKQAIPRGVVCFISNFSYLGDPSYVVMRQRLLGTFDTLWFDCLNGDSRETGKLTPEGKPDPSIFSTTYNREGIRTGTAIALLLQTGLQKPKPDTYFRHFWGKNKRQELLQSLDSLDFNQNYTTTNPIPETRFSFRPAQISTDYLAWAKITDFCAIPPHNGLMEKRGGALMSLERDTLEMRMQAYCNPELGWSGYKELHYGLVEPKASFDPKTVRCKFLLQEQYEPSRIVRYALRPFEVRWCYYTAISGVWNRARSFLWKQCWPGNSFLVTRPAGVASPEGVPFFWTSLLGDNDALRGHAYYFPLQLMNGSRLRPQEQLSLGNILGEKPKVDRPFANLSTAARRYLAKLSLPDPDPDRDTAQLIWFHTLAIGYSPVYLTENADGICLDFPRIPLPATATQLQASAALGKKIAALLDSETPVAGVTGGKLQPGLKFIAQVARQGGGQLDPNTDFTLSAGWGGYGQKGSIMPGKGKVIQRDYQGQEGAEAGLGEKTNDVYLNEVAYWQNIPDRVWNYTIGGYQVIKKWLSYREEVVLGRSLRLEEVQEVTNIARRIAAILLLEPQLDANYQAVKANLYSWGGEADQ